MPDQQTATDRQRRIGTRLGRIAGVPILLSRSWPVSLVIVVVVVAALAGRVLPTRSGVSVVVAALSLTALLMLGVLVHELGHLIAAKAMGQRVLRIRFDVLGGQTDLIGPADTAGRDAVVAVAGPLASAAFALAGLGTAQAFADGSTPWLLAMTVCIVNGLLALFNLLPAIPLDGGEILRTLVWRITGRRRTGTIAGFAGAAVVCGALVVLAVLLWVADASPGRAQAVVLLAMGVHLGGSGWAEWRAWRREVPMRGPGPDDHLDASPGGAAGPEPDSAGPLSGYARRIAVLDVGADAGQVAATGRDVLLIDTDGTIAGIVDQERVLGRPPGIAAVGLAAPHEAGAVVLATDDTEQIRRLLQHTRAERFLLTDEDGEPAGILARSDLTRILTDRGPTGHRPGPAPHLPRPPDDRGSP